MAVAVTSFLLLFVSEGGAQADPGAASAAAVGAERADLSVAEATEEAVTSLRAVWIGFRGNLPKFLIAIGVLALGWMLGRSVRSLAVRITKGWSRSQAISALAGIAVWMVAIGLCASVLVGDLRALVGSLGLIGLALSWALQTPIESFTGWLLNSFQGYYRVGDRVSVSEVFGDVVKIDFLTTTVWEIGSPQRPGFVHAEQPTGRVVTFPNSEVLTGTIMNLTRDFPYAWDELTIVVANESDLRHAMAVLERVACELLGEQMREPAASYRRSAGICRASRLVDRSFHQVSGAGARAATLEERTRGPRQRSAGPAGECKPRSPCLPAAASAGDCARRARGALDESTRGRGSVSLATGEPRASRARRRPPWCRSTFGGRRHFAAQTWRSPDAGGPMRYQ